MMLIHPSLIRLPQIADSAPSAWMQYTASLQEPLQGIIYRGRGITALVQRGQSRVCHHLSLLLHHCFFYADCLLPEKLFVERARSNCFGVSLSQGL